MTLGIGIHAAIARLDSTALRKMANDTPDQEAQMFLTLLASIIDRHLKEKVRPKKKTGSLGRSQCAGQLRAA